MVWIQRLVNSLDVEFTVSLSKIKTILLRYEQYTNNFFSVRFLTTLFSGTRFK